MSKEMMTIRIKNEDLFPIPVGKTFEDVLKEKIEYLIKRQSNLGWEVESIEREESGGVLVHLVR